MERDGFAQVDECFLFRLALAGHVNFEALGDIPVALMCDAGDERALHNGAPLVAVER